MLSKIEVDVLLYLFDNQYNNQMNSISIKKLSTLLNLNYFRLRNIIGHLNQLKLIFSGYKERNAFCYYISEKGIEIIKDFKSSFKEELL